MKRASSSSSSNGGSIAFSEQIQVFLDRFFTARIGIRVLLGQFAALHEQLLGGGDERTKAGDVVGIIDRRVDIMGIAEQAVGEAQDLCSEYFGVVEPPQVHLVDASDPLRDAHPLDSFAGKLRLPLFTYIPEHLHHMLLELLKNSMRATVEHSMTRGLQSFPPIRLILARGREDITLKVADEGGGIRRSALDRIWQYMYTTASASDRFRKYQKVPSSILEDDIDGDDDEEQQSSDGSQRRLGGEKPLLTGFGYGLPLSRLYARYFGGDLRIVSMEGFGTDAYLHLPRLSRSEKPLSG